MDRSQNPNLGQGDVNVGEFAEYDGGYSHRDLSMWLPQYPIQGYTPGDNHRTDGYNPGEYQHDYQLFTDGLPSGYPMQGSTDFPTSTPMNGVPSPRLRSQNRSSTPMNGIPSTGSRMPNHSNVESAGGKPKNASTKFGSLETDEHKSTTSSPRSRRVPLLGVKGKLSSVDQSVPVANRSPTPDAGATSSSLNEHTEIRLTIGDLSTIFTNYESRFKGAMDEALANVYTEIDSVKAEVYQYQSSVSIINNNLATVHQRICECEQSVKGLNDTKFTSLNQTVGMVQDRLLTCEQSLANMSISDRAIADINSQLQTVKKSVTECMAHIGELPKSGQTNPTKYQNGQGRNQDQGSIWRNVSQDSRYQPCQRGSDRQENRQDQRSQRLDNVDVRFRNQASNGYANRSEYRQPTVPKNTSDARYQSQAGTASADRGSNLWFDQRMSAFQNEQNSIHCPAMTNRSNNTTLGSRVHSDVSKYIPKIQSFDGTTQWTTFKNMFDVRAVAFSWSEADKFTNIQMCLTGKALDFFIKMKDQGKCRTYDDTIRRMELRFDRKEDPHTLQLQFTNLKQTVDETIEDWSERVMTLGHEAYEGLASGFIEQQIVFRFCAGSIDKDAAQHVMNSQPATLEEAIQRMKRFKENNRSIFGNSKRVHYLSSRDRSKSPDFRRRSRSPSPKKTDGAHTSRQDQSKSLPAKDKEFKQNLEEWLSKTLIAFFDSQSNRSRSVSPKRACFVCKSPEHLAPDCPKKVDGACYLCGDKSHKYMECSKYKLESESSGHQENCDRSGRKADTRS